MMEEKKEPFVVDSLAKANWVMDKISEKRAKIAEIEAAYNERTAELKEALARYDAWKVEETATFADDIANLENFLRPWAESEISGGKKKSVKLAGGVVGFRKGAEKWTMGGEVAAAGNEKLLAWVKTNANEYVKTIESVRWADFKKHLTVTDSGKVVTSDGEIVEGLMVEQEPDVFYVK